MAKYSIAELTKVASRKTGEIEAQCQLNSEIDSLENGEIVYVDAVNNEITKTFNADTCVDAIYLHFSNPRRYEDGHTGMENFRYERNDKYLPRVYKLTVGDMFMTDYEFDSLEFGSHEIVEVDASNIAGVDDLLPNMKAGKLYRVIK